MSELLFEIFSEEIPARMQANACMDLEKLFAVYCDKAKISYKKLETFVTPRRLGLCVSGVEYTSGDIVQEKRGPRVGADQKAVASFALSCSLTVDDLKVRSMQGSEYYFASISFDTASLKKDLTHVLEKIMATLPWPKTMRWDSSNVIWVRPVRNIMCLLSGEILPIKFGVLTANNRSYGHRILAPNWFEVENFDDYKEKLEKHKVVLNRNDRRFLIGKQIDEILSKLGLELVHDENLLNEVVGLVEYPVALLGKIETRFLSLPKEILATTIRVHQKFFSLKDRDGNAAPYFITIANNDPQDKGLIIKGNETVLRARLCDAEFFFNEDKKISLATRVPSLSNVVFHKKLGSVLDKTERMVELAQGMACLLDLKNIDVIKRAALLSKADLTTNIVSEFAELQGVAGKYYASYDKENSVVSETMSDHYLPRGRYDSCPALIESAVIAIADKLDSIVGLFYADEAPTSSKDPYGLRRNALGIIRILVESKLDVGLSALVDCALDSYDIEDRRHFKKQIIDFFVDRFRFFVKDLGARQSTVLNAVMSRSETNLYRDYNKIHILADYISSDSGSKLYAAVKRTNNILKDAMCGIRSVDSQLLENKFEIEIFRSVVEIEKDMDKISKSATLLDRLLALETLAELLNAFFENTMVMVDDKKICDNRLSLLTRVTAVFNKDIDFTAIEL
jgi:glycyl-tRNA synthetase beta chain